MIELLIFLFILVIVALIVNINNVEEKECELHQWVKDKGNLTCMNCNKRSGNE